MTAAATAAALLLACGDGGEDGSPPVDPGGDCPACDAGALPMDPDDSSYVTGTAAGTPGLRLEVSPEADRAALRVLTTGPVDLFGLSLHVRYDSSRFAASDVAQAAFLGPEGDESTMVAVPREGDLVLGGTRNDPALGDASLGEGVELASFTLRGLAVGDGRVAIVDVVARRSDGTYVALGAEAGTLSLAEVAR